MNFSKNPFFENYSKISDKISDSKNREEELIRQIAWYANFDANELFIYSNKLSRKINQLKNELDEISKNLEKLNIGVKNLDQKVRFGWNPSYWFSSERSAKIKQLDDQRKSINLLERRKNEIWSAIPAEKAQLANIQAQLDRYRAFDRLEAEATVNALKFQLLQLHDEFNLAKLQKERADEHLLEPLKELEKFQQKRCTLENEIFHAENFEKRLNNVNSYNRKMIHDECKKYFGEGSPTKIIVAKNNELEGVNRSIRKLEIRVQLIIKRLTRLIKLIVIDGNNLCYQQHKFIGISALRAVAQKLTHDFSVIIIFDAAIRSQLQMSDQEISAQFGEGVRVHVVASKKTADETLLDTASDADAYVISNDNFRDFPDKPVVRERRLIQHEVLNNRVYVHDLSVAETWT